jgi:hypothetical protein
MPVGTPAVMVHTNAPASYWLARITARLRDDDQGDYVVQWYRASPGTTGQEAARDRCWQLTNSFDKVYNEALQEVVVLTGTDYSSKRRLKGRESQENFAYWLGRMHGKVAFNLRFDKEWDDDEPE